MTISFTFHYGSILIYIRCVVIISINVFTFHYGSILIICSQRVSLYFPIYIPLWFYSNGEKLLSAFDIMGFTFHYGSILILSDVLSKSPLKYLHSTMVLF